MNYLEDEMLALGTTAERCCGCGEEAGLAGGLYGTDDGRLLCHECLGEEDFAGGGYLDPSPSDILDPSKMQTDPPPVKSGNRWPRRSSTPNPFGCRGKPEPISWVKEYPEDEH